MDVWIGVCIYIRVSFWDGQGDSSRKGMATIDLSITYFYRADG